MLFWSVVCFKYNGFWSMIKMNWINVLKSIVGIKWIKKCYIIFIILDIRLFVIGFKLKKNKI